MPVLHLLLVAWLLPLCALCFFPLAVRLWRLLLIRARRRPPSRPLRTVFLHPDLGIGGAERLVVDAASVLQARGHSVLIVTSHHDRSRCFEETRDGTLAVAVAGAVVPRHVRGRLHVLCATVRGLAGAVWLLASEPGCDVAVVDQVAPPVALLRLAGARPFAAAGPRPRGTRGCDSCGRRARRLLLPLPRQTPRHRRGCWCRGLGLAAAAPARPARAGARRVPAAVRPARGALHGGGVGGPRQLGLHRVRLRRLLPAPAQAGLHAVRPPPLHLPRQQQAARVARAGRGGLLSPRPAPSPPRRRVPSPAQPLPRCQDNFTLVSLNRFERKKERSPPRPSAGSLPGAAREPPASRTSRQ